MQGWLLVVEVVAVAVGSAVVVAVVAIFVVVVIATEGQGRLLLPVEGRPLRPQLRPPAGLVRVVLVRLVVVRRRLLGLQQQLLAANGPASQPPVI